MAYTRARALRHAWPGALRRGHGATAAGPREGVGGTAAPAVFLRAFFSQPLFAPPSALALLSVMGCDMVQGYLISRPLGIEAFHRFLDDDSHVGGGNESSSFLRPELFWKRA